MSYGVLECDSYATQLHAYDFVIKYLLIIKKALIRDRPCIFLLFHDVAFQSFLLGKWNNLPK